MVGAEESTFTVGCADEDEEAAGAAAAGCAGAGAAPVEAPVVGLPRRCPEPPKGLYVFFGAT